MPADLLEAPERCEHNEEHECFDCATARHAAAHPELVKGCLSCKLSTIQVSPRVGTRLRPSGPPAGNRNSWEKGRVRDGRGAPLLGPKGLISTKEYAANRAKYEERRRFLATHPDPFGDVARDKARTR